MSFQNPSLSICFPGFVCPKQRHRSQKWPEKLFSGHQTHRIAPVILQMLSFILFFSLLQAPGCKELRFHNRLCSLPAEYWFHHPASDILSIRFHLRYRTYPVCTSGQRTERQLNKSHSVLCSTASELLRQFQLRACQESHLLHHCDNVRNYPDS